MSSQEVTTSSQGELINHLYMRLATDETLWSSSLKEALHRVTENLCEAIDTSRVSVWVLDGKNILSCSDLYISSDSAHSEGYRLARTDFPAYFSALDKGRILNVPDARLDPNTSEFLTDYLEPNNILSLIHI